ncbi:MAG: TetR family transcriptional regulator [Pseudonocardiaceae bacterium]|nr:TetR family transcriptional regulator [Pseudonocardiaceae bacterium]
MVDSRALDEVPHSEVAHTAAAPTGGRREQRKQRTRRAVLDAALNLLEEHAFEGLSLRQVTRTVGIVPTAFYRHFDDMDALGIELVDESVGTLRRMIRAAREEDPDYGVVIERSVQLLVGHVHAHRPHFRFIVRQRFSGVAAVRLAIREQFELFVAELATDLQRFGLLTHWPLADRLLLADIIVNQMISTAEAILDMPPDDPTAEQQVIDRAERQLRMIVIGLSRWKT